MDSIRLLVSSPAKLELNDIPALLVTGDTAPDQVLRVHESGHIVLYKPVQPKELLTVLKKLA